MRHFTFGRGVPNSPTRVVCFTREAHLDSDQPHCEGTTTTCGQGVPFWALKMMDEKCALNINSHHLEN